MQSVRPVMEAWEDLAPGGRHRAGTEELPRGVPSTGLPEAKANGPQIQALLREPAR